MKKLFVHPDGRLKTGILAVVAFFLVLGLADLAFEVKNRSATEIVKVRHVFEEFIPEKPLLPRVEEKVQPEKAQVREEAPTQEEIQPREVQLEEEIPVVKKEVPPQEIQPEKRVQPSLLEPEPTQKEMVAPQPVPEIKKSEPVFKPVQEAHVAPWPVVNQQESSRFEVQKKRPDNMTRLVTFLGEKKVEVPKKMVGERDFTVSDELKALAGSKKTETTPVVSPAGEFLSSVQKTDSSEKVPEEFKGTVVSDSEVRLSGQEYNEMFKSWRNAGSKDDGRKQLSFRVQNLRRNYKLLQMKPVVVRHHTYFDLHTGAPLLEKFLQEYSSLQLVVEKPWQEWGPELKHLGVRTGDDFSVRYLLYGFIDRAMQHRVNMAFDCGMTQGLIPAETAPEQVEIVGRVFQVTRDGGGRFGVFVPRTLHLKDRSEVAVPPQCFAKSADVQMLMAAGVVR